MNQFFLYARKSTDVEDKQVLSIEAQLTELRTFARQEKLEISEEFIEKQSAKMPGRPVFNSMVKKIEQGEANGILAWHPDRLARNSVDGGKLIYLLDTNELTALKFPQFWFEPTPQGKFMLNIAFGQSKYYVDALSENTKRGLRQKIRRGEYPSLAPVGYLNDQRTKTIVVEKKRAPIIHEAFERHSDGTQRLEDIADFLADNNIASKSGKRMHLSRVTYILSNPFYCGLFRYNGELYEGKHEPIVSKQLFDKVQQVLQQRGRPHKQLENHAQPFCGLLRCGSCGMMITGEYRIKRQKNGTEHHYVYYHCTKKRKGVSCSEPCIRQEVLNQQLSEFLQRISLPPLWVEYLNTRLQQDRATGNEAVRKFTQTTMEEIRVITNKLQRLLDGYLEQDIDRDIYRKEKGKLLGEKASLEEKIGRLAQAQTAWLEPLKNWIQTASTLGSSANNPDYSVKKLTLAEIFGLYLDT